MLDVSATFVLSLGGPVITRSTESGAYGVDAPAARDEHGRLCLPWSLVRGRLKEALDELRVAAGSAFDPPLAEWFGVGSDQRAKQPNETVPPNNHEEYGSAVDPFRGSFSFSNFIYEGPQSERMIHRISIDEARGAVNEGALQVIEAPFRSGEVAHFKGSVSFFAKDADRADDIAETVRKGFCWITSMGGEKGVGFGQLTAVTLASLSVSKVVAPQIPASVSAPNGFTLPPAPAPTHFDLVIRPQSPFCLTRQQVDLNLFESDEIIPGAAIKGSLATTWLKLLGGRGVVRADVDTERPELCEQFEKVRFTHAFPARRGTKQRPTIFPYSTVADGDGELHDVALREEVALIESGGVRRAPSFFLDWKDKVLGEAYRKFGWDFPLRRLEVHHEHDRAHRRAMDARLFAYEMVIPHAHEWYAQVDLSRVDDAGARTAVAAQLRSLFAARLRDLGKTSAPAIVEMTAEGVFRPSFESNLEARDGLWVITLQTPALLCDPSTLNESSGHEELLQSYREVWHQLSGEALELKRFFARQRLAGGEYLRGRFMGKELPYNPYLLTEAGSVFVLKSVRGKESGAEERAREWHAGGLPLPCWADKLFRRREHAGSHWSNCPYIPENGYGEIAVNLSLHWERDKAKKFYDIK